MQAQQEEVGMLRFKLNIKYMRVAKLNEEVIPEKDTKRRVGNSDHYLSVT